VLPGVDLYILTENMLKQNSLEDAEVAIIYGTYHTVLYDTCLLALVEIEPVSHQS
jgi:hypothetical protein